VEEEGEVEVAFLQEIAPPSAVGMEDSAFEGEEIGPVEQQWILVCLSKKDKMGVK